MRSEPLEERADKIIAALKHKYPDVHYYLDFSTPLELLVAAILSSQCRDEVVNAVTKGLFSKYKAAVDYATVELRELEEDINRITFYRNKAKHIQESCRILLDKYDREVPQTLEELVKLPGIGKKTANAILINAFDKVTGIVVDTHVIRLANRLALTGSKNPDKIERDLKEIVPQADWKVLPWLLKAHGRAVCTAQKPKCSECVLDELCPKIQKLEEYCKKRDFSKTDEPKVNLKSSREGDKPIYVIQKHHATHLHYDLRLEHGGALKSWAVPKGPSTKVGERRLAVEVEDHPLEYAGFEGVIAEGQYGAGKVEIWDRGYFQPVKWEENEIIIDIRGEKLKGRYCLIRFQPEKNRKNWLLFRKRSG